MEAPEIVVDTANKNVLMAAVETDCQRKCFEGFSGKEKIEPGKGRSIDKKGGP